MWRSFGETVTPGTKADGNGDGTIDIDDYVVWRKQMAGGAAPAPPAVLPLTLLKCRNREASSAGPSRQLFS